MFFFLRTHTACCKYEAVLPHLPLYYYRGAYRVPLFICFVCVCVCATFFVFSDCEGFMYEADFHKPGIYGSGRVWASAWGAFRRGLSLEVVAVAGLMWVSWCVFDGADFFRIFHEFAFSNSYTQSSQRRLGEGDPTASQSAHRQLALTYPTRCTV